MKLLAIESGGTYVDVATPSNYETILEELVKASRNTLGNLYKFRINTKFSISIEWNVLTSAEKTQLMSLTSGNQFNVRFFDLNDSTFKYANFYRGSDYHLSPIGRFNGSDFKYYNVSMEVIQL